MKKSILFLLMICACSTFRYDGYVADNNNYPWRNRLFDSQMYLFCDIPDSLNKIKYEDWTESTRDEYSDCTDIYFNFRSSNVYINIFGKAKNNSKHSTCDIYLSSKKDSIRFGLNNVHFYSNSDNLINYSYIRHTDSDTTKPMISKKIGFTLIFNLNTDTIKTLKVEFDSLEINGTKHYVEPLHLKQIKKHWTRWPFH